MNEIYWKAHTFKYKKKGVDWYWIFWSISFLLIFSIYYFWEDNIFSLMVFILAITITLGSFKKPEVNKYTLKQEGIFMENEKSEILFENIRSYNIDIGNLKILINTKNRIQPLVHIPFQATQNISKIDSFLSSKIEKDLGLKIPTLELLINKMIGF